MEFIRKNYTSLTWPDSPKKAVKYILTKVQISEKLGFIRMTSPNSTTEQVLRPLHILDAFEHYKWKTIRSIHRLLYG